MNMSEQEGIQIDLLYNWSNIVFIDTGFNIINQRKRNCSSPSVSKYLLHRKLAQLLISNKSDKAERKKWRGCVIAKHIEEVEKNIIIPSKKMEHIIWVIPKRKMGQVISDDRWSINKSRGATLPTKPF